MQLKDRIEEYNALLEKKASLEAETKENNKALKELEQSIATQMIDEETPGIMVGEYNYTLSQTIRYSKKSEEALAEAGIDFFETLRNEGLGNLIVETVNPRTLQSAMKAYAEENDGLSDDLSDAINQYEEIGVNKRKATSKALKRAKEERNK